LSKVLIDHESVIIRGVGKGKQDGEMTGNPAAVKRQSDRSGNLGRWDREK